MTDKEKFHHLELSNVKCDVMIDDEEYEKVFEILKLRGEDFAGELKRELGDETVPEETLKNKCYKYLLEKRNPESKPRLIVEDIDLIANDFAPWLPLFFAKAVRAYLSKNGSDDAMACLDVVLMYLHNNLPKFRKSNDTQEFLLQHLYFQELAACGKPGLESLGYALRAADILKQEAGLSFHNIKLYKLWASLNQGIGYLHSEQRMKAALEFNAIIKKFDQAAEGISEDDKKYWRMLLYDQAVLYRAELQEELQFSYHTMKTLQRLGKNAKKGKRLIKEALAYRDIRRFDEALKKIRQLLWDGKESGNSGTTLKAIFDRFERWKRENKKTGISSETAGLLFDFYLAKFEDQDPKKDDVKTFTAKLKKYADELMKSKPERASYLPQVARYLQWLSDKYEKNSSDGFYNKQINVLYPDFRKHINLDTGKIPFKDFDIYDYDRFVDSLEKFYRNCNKPSDERIFLDSVESFEKEEFYLYDFKKLERDQRIAVLDNGLAVDCTARLRRCFHKQHKQDCQLFRGLLHCKGNDRKSKGRPEQTRETATDEVEELMDHDYEAIMTQENERFLDYLQYHSFHPIPEPGKCSYHFMGLQRWNSQTPTLTLSKGGGYLLYKQDNKGAVKFGIAIDPGFDFVNNLFHMGFTLKDINFILLTHAHLDHIRDFEPIVSALLDLKKRAPEEKKVKGKIHAVMTLGVYRKLENVITNTVLREFLADTYIVDIEREIDGRKKTFKPIGFRKNEDGSLVSILDDKDGNFLVKIIPTRAYHDDKSECSDSFGYIINVADADCHFRFGYSGDTRWHEDIGPQYSKCDVVCIHLGALIESEDEKNEKNKFGYYRGQHCEELIEKKWHPYLFGLLRWIKAIKTDEQNKNKLILLSEFGEELKGGIRIDLVRRLNEMFPDKSRVCIPVDIGLNVVLSRTPGDTKPYQVWCFGCDSFVSAENIRYRHFGYGRGDEALFYFCETCLKSKPPNVLQDKMRHICESGIPLKKNEFEEK